VSNVLNEPKKRQVIALGRLGWSLRRIQKAIGVRRETAAAYMREAGIAVRSPGLWGCGAATPAVADAGPLRTKPAIGYGHYVLGSGGTGRATWLRPSAKLPSAGLPRALSRSPRAARRTAVVDGTRKEFMMTLTTVPLLIVD
jgi:hypothetical protein